VRSFYLLLTFVVGLGILLSCFVLFHLGNGLWQFAQLVGAFVGGSLTLSLALLPIPSSRQVEPWSGKERWSWILIGCGAIMWSIGEACWRYYILVLHQPPFPSWADVGYSSLPPLVFLGLLCLPLSNRQSNQAFIILDSLIVAGSLLALGWFLLLGLLASVSNENLLAKVLGLYYPTSDIALLSCIFFITRRSHEDFSQIKARRYGLILLGIGLAVFALSDFLFNVQQNLGIYVDGTWVDLGWPLGLLIVSIAASLRRFMPALNISPQTKLPMDQALPDPPGLSYLVVYVLVGSLFSILCLNIFSTDRMQVQLRPMLLVFALIIVALLIVRQVVVIRENTRLLERQAILLEQLEQSNYQLEVQSRRVAQHNVSLERGITHLKEVLAQLANGDMQARAHISSGELLSLAGSLNLMAERLSHTEMIENSLLQQTKALNDFICVLEKRRSGQPVSLPASYRTSPEMRRLALAIGIQEGSQPPLTNRKAIRAVSLRHPLSLISQGHSAHSINTRVTPIPPGRSHSPAPNLSD
jgi:hypothetical protein